MHSSCCNANTVYSYTYSVRDHIPPHHFIDYRYTGNKLGSPRKSNSQVPKLALHRVKILLEIQRNESLSHSVL